VAPSIPPQSDIVAFLDRGDRLHRRRLCRCRTGGTLVSIVGPPEARPDDGLAVDFVVESDRAQLSEIVQRVRDGQLGTNIGNVSTLDDAVAAFNPTERRKGRRSSAFVRFSTCYQSMSRSHRLSDVSLHDGTCALHGPFQTPGSLHIDLTSNAVSDPDRRGSLDAPRDE
jgi:hypothetical protein